MRRNWLKPGLHAQPVQPRKQGRRSRQREDYYIQKRRGWVRLHEKGGKVTELPCHLNLEQFLDEWIAASGTGGRAECAVIPDAASRPAERPHAPAPAAEAVLRCQSRWTSL